MLWLALLVPLLIPAPLAAQESVFLEDLTWTEVRDALRTGTTTAIIPTGGTEQNGPHMVLGKHNYIVRWTSEALARRLGNTLVAPVMAYVPEGDVEPPTGHMWAPGTITLPDEDFRRVVEYAVRSLAQHGFVEVILLGDSGPNQAGLAAVAEMLNREWASGPTRVFHLREYYMMSPESGVQDWLRERGETDENVGTHAGIIDTSLLLAIHPAGIRQGLLAPGAAGDGSGVVGNPTRASVAYGQALGELIVEAAVRQLNTLRSAPR